MQEPKYFFSNGNIFNRASGEMIPEDEPVMIFRGRDIHAVPMIQFYGTLVKDEEHKAAVQQRLEDFANFASQHAERMKEPDTQLNLFG